MARNVARSVGIRELKQDASRIIRQMRESGEEMAVTVRGEVVAVLVPVTTPRRRRIRSPWTEFDALARKIGRRWPKGESAGKAVREQRR
jgi:antitoxin (DNA-binding transcriptional repressor) of toxin-antitoxin stability system